MRLLLGFLLLSSGLVVSGPTATAGEPTASVVSPSDGDRMGGTVPVTMQVAGATHARLRVTASLPGPNDRWLGPVPVDDSGTATVDLPTWGFFSFSLAAEPCAGPEPETCTVVAADPLWVTATNEPPTIVDPAQPRVVKPSVDGPLPVRVSGVGPVAAVRYLDRAPTRIAPGEEARLDLSLAPWSRGSQGRVYAWWCNPVLPDVCSGAAAAGPDLVVREELHGAVVAVSDVRISPNDDGRQDETSVVLDLDGYVGQTATWSILDGAGETAAGPFLGGHFPPGPHDKVVVVDPWPRTGATMPSGRYTLRLHLTRDVDGHHFARDLDVPLVVDTTPPATGRVATSRARVHPRPGGLPGSVRLLATPRDSWRHVGVEVLDRKGHVVRTLDPVRVVDGDLRGAAWDGRTDGGALVPAGRYRLRLVVEDGTGNRARALTAPVTVDLTRR
ncbi:FlgD immunoglobulin-like domain containing protein [Nocardioides sp. GCM10027113]|uniref:FlgD immunoglobulin-like domain containing protein n=1 Tax=unclassified Nocardioides TaxID=2615069 RepID=UPI00361F0AB4